MTYSHAEAQHLMWLAQRRSERLQGVQEGRYSPINDEEQRIAPKVQHDQE